ncbi:MAG: NAD(P)H-dependent oxidoreductase subunit E [Victivallaceae bacterium]|nr:NAD(P)H-dependent oxidoreductase subunit E [Victivallaceae bacterium]
MEKKYGFLEKIDREPSNLIKGLQAVQGVEGFVSDESIKAVSEYFGIPEVEIEGVLSFYAQFKRVKPGKYKVSLCDGTACHIKGSTLVHNWVCGELGIKDGETDKDGNFSLETVACLGCCSLAPVMSVNGRVYAKLDRKTTTKILKEYASK